MCQYANDMDNICVYLMLRLLDYSFVTRRVNGSIERYVLQYVLVNNMKVLSGGKGLNFECNERAANHFQFMTF